MKINKPQPQQEPQNIKPKMTNEEIKNSIHTEEKHFEDLMSKVDESKTQTKQNSAGDEVTIFYDKNGKELYTKTETDTIEIYNFQASDGGLVQFSDYDKDGIMDRMTYSGKDDISIYMSNNYNDVPTAKLEQLQQKISFLGDMDCNKIYMDLYNGWTHSKNDLTGTYNLLKLNI